MNIVITGISKGLGFALANEYCNSGHTVYGFSRGIPTEIHKNLKWTQCDLISTDAHKAVAEAVSDLRCVDLLINNAGSGCEGTKLQEIEIDAVEDAFNIHCLAPMMMLKAVLEKLKGSANPKVINVTSRFGSVSRHLSGDFNGLECSYSYRIAKSAQNMLTLCLQGDPTLSRIIVAAMNPGLLKTDSGANDAKYSAKQGAVEFAKVVDRINENGAYHAFGDDPTL